MMKSYHEELEMTIEGIRLDTYPEIQESIVKAIIGIEIENQDNRALALQQVQSAIRNYSKSVGQENA